MYKKELTISLDYDAWRSIKAHVWRRDETVEGYIVRLLEAKAAELKAERSAAWKAARKRNLEAKN